MDPSDPSGRAPAKKWIAESACEGRVATQMPLDLVVWFLLVVARPSGRLVSRFLDLANALFADPRRQDDAHENHMDGLVVASPRSACFHLWMQFERGFVAVS